MQAEGEARQAAATPGPLSARVAAGHAAPCAAQKLAESVPAVSHWQLPPSQAWGGRTAVRPLTQANAIEDHDEVIREGCGRGRSLLCVRVKVEIHAV